MLAFKSFIIESSVPQITTMEQGLERQFGGFPLSAIGARARELAAMNPRAKFLPAEMTIGSAVVLIFEQQQLVRKGPVDKFPCTRDEWYKYIFWPVHANDGNYPSDPRANTPSPYTQLATTMRAGGIPEYDRGSSIHPRTTKITEELGRSLNHLELRKAPPLRLRFQYASLSAYQRVITRKLKPRYQSPTVPTTAPTSVLASLIPVSLVFM